MKSMPCRVTIEFHVAWLKIVYKMWGTHIQSVLFRIVIYDRFVFKVLRFLSLKCSRILLPVSIVRTEVNLFNINKVLFSFFLSSLSSSVSLSLVFLFLYLPKKQNLLCLFYIETYKANKQTPMSAVEMRVQEYG